ncbi:DNA-binding MarR family transcriptional regulator [Saccharothrix tamanrassetensis]|uniref:DNA-binding MarR family transcriptional regulator n=1 Tax=Saccharothrix tamanrassetensis TaxID=1051531 RepID=A0A841CHT8_9PSEU|nr:MarR family transcriptional regulator [Saccharothrix tamanrassetensis]MBB5956961.1 DNA-binding MarR family transcriptional regulator [Saccharothrix tamanrassetensis]
MVDNAALVRLLRQLIVESDHFVGIFGEVQGMHRTDLNALALIMDAKWRGEPLSPGTLAEAMHLSASATTSVLDRLESAGHVQRTRSTRDRRRVELRVPDRALELGRRFFAPLDGAFGKAWAGFSDAEKATIARFLAASIEATVAVRGEFAAFPRPPRSEASTGPD